MIENKGSLTIVDSVGGGKIRFKDTGSGDSNFGWGSYTIINKGTLVVGDSESDLTFTIEHLGEQNSDSSVIHMYCAIQQAAGSTTINNGIISNPTYRSVRINKGDLIINDGIFEGQIWLQPNQGDTTIIINGGTFAPRGADGSSVFMENSIESHTVSSASITGGTFTTKIGVSDATKTGVAGSIIGGTFAEAAKANTNPALINTNYKLPDTADENGYYKVSVNPDSKVAEIDGVGYASLSDAVLAAKNGETIKLVKNIEQADGVLITNKKLTIDLNDKEFNVTDGASTNNRNFKINGDSEVTIKNGTMYAKGDYSSGAYGTVRTEDNAKVTLTDLKLYNSRGNGLNVKACTGTTVTISDTKIYSEYGGGVEAAGGTIELTNVIVEQKGMYTAPYNSMAISVNGGGTAIVYSGTYSTECITAEEANNQGTSHGPWAAGVLNSGGTLIINGGTFSNDNFGENSLATYARGLLLADAGAKIEINGGTFNALKAIIDITNNLGDASNNPSATISGGIFSADPRVSGLYASELIKLAENHICIGPDVNGKYTVEEKNPEITVTPESVDFGSLDVGYGQPAFQTVTVQNTGNVELTLTIAKDGFENITITRLPDSPKTLAVSDSFSFTVQPDAGLTAGNYGGTITLSNESIEDIVITVSFIVTEPTDDEPDDTPSDSVSSGGSGKDTGSGNYQYYPRTVPADGIIDFGTSKVVSGMELPVGSSGTVTLNTKPTFAMPENGFYAFEIDAPGYNLDAKINGAVSFKLSVADLEAAGWTAKDIVLFHGTIGEGGKITWEALPTNLVKNEAGIAYYKAAINGCSPFYIGFVKDGSIVNTEVVDPVTPPTETPDVPGEVLPEIPPVDEPETPESPAPLAAVIAALGAAVLLRRK